MNKPVLRFFIFAACLVSMLFMTQGCFRPSMSGKSGKATPANDDVLPQHGAHFKHLAVGDMEKWGQGLDVANGENGRGLALHLDVAAKETFEHDVDVWCETDAGESLAYSGWSNYGGQLTFLAVCLGRSLESVRVGICIRSKLGESAASEPVYRAVLDGRVLERARANVQSALQGDSSTGMRSLRASDYLHAEAELIAEGIDIKTEGRLWPNDFCPF